MKDTKIEWANHTFNPWIGCTKVSPACDHCYAENLMDSRMHIVQWGTGQPRKRTGERNWNDPKRWNAEAERLGVRYRVFCSSLADVFDNEVPVEWRRDLFNLIFSTPHLDWLLLTKRIGNAKAMIDEVLPDSMKALPTDSPIAWPWPHVWIGATICNQAEADRDIPKLLAVPAEKRFLSMEPLLGPVSLDCWPVYAEDESQLLHWVIVGGESGPHARPMHPDWVRSLRDQCEQADVPFLFKQHGEWIGVPDLRFLPDGQGPGFGAFDRCPYDADHEAVRVGKKMAGRLLDGRTWDEVPT